MVCPKWETCTAEDCPDRTPHPRNGYCKPSSCTCSEEKIACIPYVAEVKKSCETCGQTECPDMTPCKAMDGGYHNWIPKSDFTQKHTDMRRDYPLPNQLTPPVESQPAEPQMMVCEFALTCNDKHKTTCFPHRRARSAVAAMCERTSRTCNYIPYIPDTGKSVSEVTEVAVGEFQPAKPDGCKTFPVERIPEANTQVCPLCHGDGLERCDNPDHGLLEALTGTKSSDIGRIGCPGCGHDPQHRTKDKCPACAGTGVVAVPETKPERKPDFWMVNGVRYEDEPTARKWAEEKAMDARNKMDLYACYPIATVTAKVEWRNQ